MATGHRVRNRCGLLLPSLAIVVQVLLAASCGMEPLRQGPDFSRPADIDFPERYSGGDSMLIARESVDRWWKVFGDPQLDDLVEEALENNLDIRKAAAAVEELGHSLTQARAGRLPSVSAGGSYQRQYIPETEPFPGGGAVERESETYSASLAASFELDLWGKLSRAEEAARADLLATEENRLTVVHTIISETVSLYLQIESLERRIDIARQSIESYGKSVRMVESRYKRGLTSILDLDQAQRTLAQAESTLPQLQQELSTAQQRLSVIAGRYPGTEQPRTHPEDYFSRLSPVPEGLPSELLHSRPDIRAAEARLHASAARVGVAKSNLFPRITITGNYGYSSEEIHDLFTPDNLLWNLVAGITQPLFNSGKLLAEKNAAWSRYEQSAIDYARTVLGAFAEVEGALVTRQRQLERREHLVVFLRKARSTQEIAESRYLRGLVDYMTVLDAMQARYRAEESLILADLAILGNRVTLHRALGGCWIEEAGATDTKDE